MDVCGGGGPSGNRTRPPRRKRGRMRTINNVFVNPHCIFCAARCRPNYLVIDGNLKRNEFKVEEDIESGRETPTSPMINNAKENEIVIKQLQAIYIVREILNVGEKVCAKFLKEFEGQFDPEVWFNVCDPCKAEVWECYEGEREMNRLIRRVQFLKDNLKKKICKSTGGEGGDGRTLAVWRELRKRGIKATASTLSLKKSGGFTFKEDAPNAVVVEEEENADEEESPLVEEQGGSDDDDDDDSQSESASLDEEEPSSSSNHKKIYYKCELCEAIVRNPTHVNPHRELHFNTDKRICPVGGCGWWIGNSLKKHVKKWHGGNPPDLTRVEIVGILEFDNEPEKKSLKKPNRWSQVQYYKKPALSEESSKYFRKCEVCGRLFKTKKRLDCHMGEVHPETDTAAATSSSVATKKERASTSSKQLRQRSEGFLPKPNNPSSNPAAAVSSSVVTEKKIASTSSQEQRQDSEVFSPLPNLSSNSVAASSNSVVAEKEIESTSSQQQRQDSEVFSPLLNPSSNAAAASSSSVATEKAIASTSSQQQQRQRSEDFSSLLNPPSNAATTSSSSSAVVEKERASTSSQRQLSETFLPLPNPSSKPVAAISSSVVVEKEIASTSSQQQRQRSEGLPKPNNPSSNPSAAISSSSVVAEKESTSASSQQQRQRSEVFSTLLNPSPHAAVGRADQLARKAPVYVLNNQRRLLPEAAGSSSQISKNNQSSSQEVNSVEKGPDLVSASGGPPPPPPKQELPILKKQGPQSVSPTASTSTNQTEVRTEIPNRKKSYFCKCSKCNALVRCTTAAVNEHEKLHEPGGKGKKCDVKGCGWIINSIGQHLKNWHSKSSPYSSFDKISMPMEEWKQNRSKQGKDEDEMEKRDLTPKQRSERVTNLQTDSHGASTKHDSTSHEEASNKKRKLGRKEATKEYSVPTRAKRANKTRYGFSGKTED